MPEAGTSGRDVRGARRVLDVGEVDLVVDRREVDGLDLLARRPFSFGYLLVVADELADRGEVRMRVGDDVSVECRGDKFRKHVRIAITVYVDVDHRRVTTAGADRR